MLFVRRKYHLLDLAHQQYDTRITTIAEYYVPPCDFERL